MKGNGCVVLYIINACTSVLTLSAWVHILTKQGNCNNWKMAKVYMYTIYF